MAREERIIIYCNPDHKERWESTYPKFGVKNYEEALMMLLDIYDLLVRYLGVKKLPEIKKKLEELLGDALGYRIVH